MSAENNTINLKKMKWVALRIISEDVQEQIQEQFAIKSRAAFSEHYKFMTNEIALRIIQPIFGFQIEDIHEKHPSDWWQAVKERFAPGWFLNRWPVVYQHIDINVSGVYPSLPDISGHKGILNVDVSRGERCDGEDLE